MYFINLINYKGCEVDVEMSDQSYHQKTEIENVSDETKSDKEVWIVEILNNYKCITTSAAPSCLDSSVFRPLYWYHIGNAGVDTGT